MTVRWFMSDNPQIRCRTLSDHFFRLCDLRFVTVDKTRTAGWHEQGHGETKSMAFSSSKYSMRFAVLVTVCLTAFVTDDVAAQSRNIKRLPASQKVRTKVGDIIDEILETDVELSVPLRRSKIIRFKQNVFRIAIADPSLIEAVAFGSREIEVIGKQTGSTNVTMWVGTPDQAETLSLLITVTKDSEVDEQRRMQYGELQMMINELFPNSKVQLIPAADKLFVRGQARDEQEASRIMNMVQKNARARSGGVSDVAGTAAEPFPDAGTLPASTVIGMLRVPGVKQVMLKVRIAEVSRSSLRSLGAQFNFDVGDFTFASGLAGSASAILTGTFDDDSFNLMLNAISSNGSAKILAEPNLVVLSGQTANFLSGGQFAVPTVVGVGGAQAATTSFQNFGTSVTFTPTVLDHDRIRLNVTPTFSTLNASNSVNGIFGIDVRTVNTTVEMREGQVFAIAGLLQEQQASDESRIPLFGDIKLLKPLFANKNVSRNETELLILITPELVHPLEPEHAPTILPGMEITEPDDFDFFIFSNIEGRPNVHHRSTVWPIYRNRLRNCKKRSYETYRTSEEYYINGPHGFSN